MVSSDYLTTLRDFYQIPSGVVFWIPNGNESVKNPPEGFFTCYEAFLVYCRMWFPIPGTGIDGSYRMAPKKGMAIIQGHTSHPKAWFERFFFVRIDGEPVEESYLHLFRREWNFTRVNRILPPTPADLFAKLDLLRSRLFFWNSFTIERIRSAVELHRSRAVSQPLDVPYGVEPVIDVLPAQRQRIRSRKGKGVASENVLGNLPLQEWNPGFSPGGRSGTSEVPLPSDFFADIPPGFTTHKSLYEESRRKVVAEGSSLINESFKVAQKFVADFRECHGSVATLYESQKEDFSFPAEVAEMSGLMNGCAHAESLVPPIEGRVRQLSDSIEVSEDTAEAGTGVGDEGSGVADGEVDQPVSSFGISMSGFLDFEL
uniref:Uncharacterized protein n=1 Tax=Brassica oleracea var. oleracea TaxID=109376 RepID=A0A0D3CNS0_BRAOL